MSESRTSSACGTDYVKRSADVAAIYQSNWGCLEGLALQSSIRSGAEGETGTTGLWGLLTWLTWSSIETGSLLEWVFLCVV